MEKKCINCKHHTLCISQCRCVNERSENYKRMVADGYVCSDWANENEQDKPYEYVDHPKHYARNGKECIDCMIEKYGVKDVITFCKLNAYKYKFRAGEKPGESLDKDLRKAEWYDNKAFELKNKRVGIKSILDNIGYWIGIKYFRFGE